ncbi:MAG: HD domain-containing protein [bacterium]|nr:HD domain-containing protein [bacterium]
MTRQLREFENIINTERIIELCANTVRLYDQRVINHGERVAYIAYRIWEQLHEDDMDLTALLMLCIFHDVGVYRTGEMEEMLGYETSQLTEHSVYGYLFIKHFSPWPEYSEAILHHHTSYQAMQMKQVKCIDYAGMVHLADYVDSALISGESKETILKEIQNVRFHPQYVKVLEALMSSSDLYELLTSGDDSIVYQSLKNVHHLTFEKSIHLLEMLIHSIDFKSNVTVAHSITTAGVATFLAENMGLSPEQVKKIQIGSLVHDVGKIATPREILEKKGRLTKEEFKVMQQHVVSSEQILQGILSQEVLRIAVRHHEKLDGSGYPNGLQADDLTMEERIVAVADLTSALLSKRSYKEGFSMDQTKELMQDMASQSLVDQQLVTLVCENIEQLHAFIQSENKKIIDIRTAIAKEYKALISIA